MAKYSKNLSAVLTPLILFIFYNNISSAQSLELEKKSGVTDGRVFDIALKGDTIFVGGIFSKVGLSQSYGVSTDLEYGLESRGFPEINGEINAITSDNNGGFYIAGLFTKVDNQPRNGFAHIDRNRILTSWAPTINGVVHSMGLYQNKLYIGGDFSLVNGQTRYNLACLDKNSGQVLPFNPGANSRVLTIFIDSNTHTLYVGGGFSSLYTTSRSKAAAFNLRNDEVLPWNPGANFISPGPGHGGVVEVRKIISSDSVVFLGGTIHRSPNQYYLLAFDTSGMPLPNWSPPVPNNTILDMALSGDTLYLVGHFDSINGQPRSGIACISRSTGGSLLLWSLSVDSYVEKIIIDGANIFIGGDFAQVNGIPRSKTAKISRNSTSVQPWKIETDFRINSFIRIESELYIVGAFTQINCIDAKNIAAFSLTEKRWVDFPISVNKFVYSILVANNKLYLGGTFDSINLIPRGRLARIDIPSRSLDTWSANINPNWQTSVLSLGIRGNELFVGGVFDSISGVARKSLASVHTGTGNIMAWNPSLNAGAPYPRILKLLVNDSILYVAGKFEFLGTSQRRGLASYNIAGGGFLTNWDVNGAAAPTFLQEFSEMFIDNDRLLVGGTITNIGGKVRRKIAKVDLLTDSVYDWNINLTSSSSAFTSVQAIAKVNNDLVIGGYLLGIQGQARNSLALLYQSTDSLQPWNPIISQQEYVREVHKIIGQGNKLIVGGEFKSINDYNCEGLAIFGSRFGRLFVGKRVFCKTTSYAINYSSTGSFGNGNRFIIELSDSSGSFQNPTIIGDTIGMPTGNIVINIPGSVIPSSNYKMRLLSIIPYEVLHTFPERIQVQSSTSVSFPLTACNTYYNPVDSSAISISGNYSFNIVNQHGCDSILNIQLTILPEKGFTVNGGILTANATSGLFQWYNCDSGIAIPGENNIQFYPVRNGQYALIVNQNGCIDTSDCINFNSASINIQKPKELTIIPNPNNGSFRIKIEEEVPEMSVRIFDVSGKEVYHELRKIGFDLKTNLPSGIYSIQILYLNNIYKSKFVIIRD